MIPPFDWHEVVVAVWRADFEGSLLTVLMGFLVTASCGLVGTFVVLRRMALMGDAISHSLLPGIAIAFMITASRNTFPMMIGAMIVGMLTVLAVETLQRTSRVKADAAMGITFSAFFAVGVLLITAFSDQVDLDADCVLYGELVFVPFFPRVEFWGMFWGTTPVFRMALVWLVLLGLVVGFWKELLVTTFDPGLARSLGISPAVFHYGLMLVLSLVIVNAFEAVGAILVIAMLIIPPATALLLARRLPWVLLWVTGLASVYAVLGYHLDVWLNGTMAGSMVVVALTGFLLVWVGRLLTDNWWRRAKMVAPARV